jgi:hypothetical protein
VEDGLQRRVKLFWAAPSFCLLAVARARSASSLVCTPSIAASSAVTGALLLALAELPGLGRARWLLTPGLAVARVASS